MPRQRLTNETLNSVQRLAAAREHVRLAESILGPSASDNEVLATAKALSHLRPEQAREINHRRAAIVRQNQRLASSPDGSVDPWDESGPYQPDPTNNQAYTKEIMTTPDHAVLDSLQKRDIHAPTASRARGLSQSARQKYRLAAADDEDEGDMEDHHDIDDDHDDEDMHHEIYDHDDVGVPAEIGDEATDQILDEVGMDGLHDDEMDDDFDDTFDDEEDLNDLPDHEGLGLDEDRGDLDDMMDDNFEEGDLDDDLGEPDIFDDVDIDDPEHDIDIPDPHEHPTSSRQRPASRQSRGRRVSQGRRQAGSGRRMVSGGGGQGPSRMSLDEILDIHDDDIERTASTPLEGDDLEALLGARVDRAGQRVATTTEPRYDSPAARQRRAMLENVWDTENEPELQRRRGGSAPRRRSASQQEQPSRREAAQRRRPAYVPDRRRGTPRPAGNDREFDQVFGVDGMPDISKFFD